MALVIDPKPSTSRFRDKVKFSSSFAEVAQMPKNTYGDDDKNQSQYNCVYKQRLHVGQFLSLSDWKFSKKILSKFSGSPAETGISSSVEISWY